MGFQSNEQVTHDRINLGRLVRRLEKSVAESNWSEDGDRDVWVKSQSMLQKINHARQLLKNVELYDEMDLSSKFRQRHEDLRKTIDRLEGTVEAVNERVAPKPPRIAPVLPTIPLPPPSARGLEPSSSQAPTSGSPVAALGNTVETPAPEIDLLLGPASDTSLLSPDLPPTSTGTTLIPHSTPASSSTSTATAPAFLQNSSALQQELSDQLAQMAGQLRRNAEHFSEALSRDKAVMEGADERIGANYDVMKKERVRLRDHRGKSLGTTCLTLTSLLVVAISFIVMFFIIRFT